jgi:integrase/recombinase XerD
MLPFFTVAQQGQITKHSAMATVSVSIYFDIRKQFKHGKYPVKVRVTYKRVQTYCATGLSCTAQEFEKSYGSIRAKGEHKAFKDRLIAIENRARQIADEMEQFDLARFKTRFLRQPYDGVNVFYYFQEKVSVLHDEERFGSASTYNLAAKSFKAFQEHCGGSTKFLHFEEVTAAYLNAYEEYMTNPDKGSRAYSPTTVSINLRNLRAMFNEADAAREIDKRNTYPFGRYQGKYKIAASRNPKKALNQEQLGAFLYADVAPNSVQEKARDFWFFSYVASGMNPKDIAFLRYSDLSDTAITFYREKSKRTGRADAKPIIVTLNGFLGNIVKKYGNERVNENTFVFDVLNDEMTAERKHKAVQNFTRFINQHCKRIAATVGIGDEISMNWARHSFTTSSIRNKQDMTFVQDALGHKSMKTTMNYWAGFEEAHKSDNQAALLDLPKPTEVGGVRVA